MSKLTSFNDYLCDEFVASQFEFFLFLIRNADDNKRCFPYLKIILLKFKPNK